MFLLLTFPLINWITTCVIISKLVSLRFRYSSYLLIGIPKISNIHIKIMKKENCEHHMCHFWSTLGCIHPFATSFGYINIIITYTHIYN
jgi:hypothetical protein